MLPIYHINKLIASVLLISMLMSNVGLSMGMHSCLGRIVETRIDLGNHLQGCVMKPQDFSPTTNDCEVVISKTKSCCADDYLALDTDHSPILKGDFQIDPIRYIYTLYIGAPLKNVSPISASFLFHSKESNAPPLTSDSQSFLQVFII